MPQAMSPSAVDNVPTKSALKDGPNKSTTLEVRAPPLPHLTHGFIPLSLLIRRLVQDSHNKLGELVDSLQGGGQTDEEKKRRIIDHMQDTRKQFIKVLVLAMWSKNAGAVGEVIDLKLFLDSRQEIFHSVVYNLLDVRRNMNQARYVLVMNVGSTSELLLRVGGNMAGFDTCNRLRMGSVLTLPAEFPIPISTQPSRCSLLAAPKPP